MKLLMCRCFYCRGHRKSPFHQKRIKQLKKSYRSRTKQLLKKRNWEKLPTAIPIGYTD